MIKNSKIKNLWAFILMISLFCAFSQVIFAESMADNDAVAVYFDYNDGICRDGAVGDRPGIIGDEDEHDGRTLTTSSLVGGNNNNINDNVLPRDAHRGSADGTSGTTSASDENNASGIFWGVLIALLIAAAIILLIVLMTPKTAKKR